ncbi:acetylornithine deacetylase, partial [Pseudomonas syringae]
PRPRPGREREVLRRAMRQRLEPLAGLQKVQGDYAPLCPECAPFEQGADAELVRVAERLTGHTAAAVAFGTEAPYLQRRGWETPVRGPGDIACAHQPGEDLEMSRLDPTVRLLRQWVERHCLAPQ